MDKSTEALKAILKAIKSKDAASERTYDPAKQVEGYKKRIEGSGLDVEKETDERNLIEKFFNLPEDQNPLFDFFEVINRPQQALFGGIKEVQEGGQFLEGAKAGISGDEYVQFKKILHNMGMTETEGKLGLDDVAGFAGDVFLDPMNVPFLGVTKAAKTAKILDATNDLAKANKTVKEITEEVVKQSATLDKQIEAARLIDKGADVVSMERVKDAAVEQLSLARLDAAKLELTNRLAVAEGGVKAAEEALKAAQGIKRMASGTDLAMRAVGTGFKQSFRLADSAISGILKNLDTTYVKHAVAQGIKIENGKALLGYNNIKTSIEKIFNFAKSLPEGLFAKSRQIRGKQFIAKEEMVLMLDQKRVGIFDKADEVVERINKARQTTMKRDELLEFVTIIYENGSDVFDAGGKITRKGLDRTTTMEALIKDEDVWTAVGVTKQEADMLDNFIHKYMPDFYEEYIAEGSNTLFTVTGGNNGIVDQYRFTDKKVYEALQKRFLSIQPNDQLASIDKLSPKEIKELGDINEDLKMYEAAEQKARASGKNNQKALKKGTPRYETYTKNYAEIEKLTAKRNALLIRLKKLSASEGGAIAETRNKLLKQLEKDNGRLINLLRENAEISQKGMDSLTNIVAELQKKRTDFFEAHNLGSTGILRGQDMIDEASTEITMKHFLSESKIKELEALANEDGVTDILDLIHEFMVSAGDVLKKTMDGGRNITEGYLAHAVTPEWQALSLDRLVKSSKTNNSWVDPGALIGNTKAMAHRRYQMSIFEANEVSKGYLKHLEKTGQITDTSLLDKIKAKKQVDMFATDITTSFIDFINKTTKATGDSMLLHETIARAFSTVDGEFDNKYIMRLTPDTKPPRGFTEITVATFKKKIEGMQPFIADNPANKELIKKVTDYLTAHGSEKIAIDNNINMLVGRLVDKQGKSSMLTLIDSLNTIFKKNKLLSPGFQMRNVVGNISNMWLSGMSIPDILKYNKKAYATIKTGQELFEKVSKGVIDASKMSLDDLKILNNYREFMGHGFSELGNAIHDIPPQMLDINRQVSGYKAASAPIEEIQRNINIAKRAKNPDKKLIKHLEESLAAAKEKALPKQALYYPKKVYDDIIRFNMHSNQAQDVNFRMAMFMYAKENPEFLRTFNYGTPEEAVRRILFDYTDLSGAERDVMRKIIPFYTFTKKNLGFQIANMQKNPVKYARMIKAFNSGWDMLDLNVDEIDKFKVENFWLPIPFIGEDGKYRALKTSLPLGDLGEWLDDPFRRALSSTSPIARAPFEIALNRQVFSNMPIQEFKGQKGFQIPEIGRRLEYGINQFGLDVPVAQAFDIGRTAVQGYRGEIDNIGQALEQGVGRSLVSKIDPVATAERNAYEDLDDMQNLMRYYKQEGVDILTLAEIENQNKFKSQKQIIERIRAIRNR